MSEPRISTGNELSAPCRTCGRKVLQREHVGAFVGSGPLWAEVSHRAPCGMPCLGGGVSVRDYRAGLVHKRGACPACEAKP